MRTLLFILFGLALSVSLNAQAELLGKMVDLETKEGSVIRGKLLEMNMESYVIESATLGSITIKRDEVRHIIPAPKLKEQEDKPVVMEERDESGYAIDYHNSTHYLANPSGYSLKKGQKYYENIGVFFNSFAFGVTDNFTIAMGGEIASLLFDSRFPILYVSPRYSIPFQQSKGAFSVGGTIFSSPEDDFNGFGVLQGALTFGDRNNNLTIGSGIGFSFSDGFEDSVLPFYFSFMKRVGPKMSIVSDNFVVTYNDFGDATGILSFALRLHFKNSGAAFNAGLWRVTEDMGGVVALPFISATVPLGN